MTGVSGLLLSCHVWCSSNSSPSFECPMMSCWKSSPCSMLTSPQSAGNQSRWLCKKGNLILMLAPRRWYASNMFATTSSKLSGSPFKEEFLYNSNQTPPCMSWIQVDSLKEWSSHVALVFGCRVHQRSLL